MSTKNYLSLGIMTGTSLDGVDLSIIKSDGKNQVIFLDGSSYPFPTNIQKSIYSILGSSVNNKNIIKIENEYTNFIIKKTKYFLSKNKYKIDLIGFHGQTITHKPKKKITWQIGSAKKLYETLKIKTFYDFRSNDVLNGGNGAPLTPIFHKLLKKKYKISNAVFVNLGGISNVTIFEKNIMRSFDCGPCCSFSNDFIQYKENKKFDYNGKFALKGKTNIKIVKNLLNNPYFKKKHPKSLDRLDIKVDGLFKLNLNDGLSTINSFIAQTIFISIKNSLNKIDNIILLGGGRKNLDLIQKLKEIFNSKKILLSEEIGIDGDLAEASAFAYLAIRSMKKLPISFPSTTGVSRVVTGGKRFG